MTLHDQLIDIIVNALTADQTILSQDVLDQIADIIITADELSASAAEIFGETGATFISHVTDLFGRLPFAAPLGQVFPSAVNLIPSLILANQLDPDKLVVDTPTEFDLFTVSETALEAFSKSGDQLRVFVHEHSSSFEESAAFLDFTNDLVIDANAANLSHKMLACVAIKVGLETTELKGKRWTVSSVDDEERRLFYCKYHILLAGHLLTNPVFAPVTSALDGIADTLRSAEEYKQFSEPFEILGEINSRETVIDKLLSCYHVLENYMIRAKIAEVVGKHDAATLFGIRNFKQMEIAVEKREMDHLKNLISASWEKQIGGRTFREFVRGCFDQLFNHPDYLEAEFRRFLEKLAISQNGPLNVESACAMLPKLLYQVRCSVVHNKETEYHLSNRELMVPIVAISLTEVCLPTMQRLAFGLPSVPAPNPLHYARKELRLY